MLERVSVTEDDHGDYHTWNRQLLYPLSTAPDYIRFSHFLLAHYISSFEHV